MKKISSLVLLIAASTSVFAQQRNSLLQADFWKQKPSLEVVKAEISKGNDPAQLDGRQMDPTSLAINADASLDVLQYLLAQKGNSVTKGTHHSRTYLHWAASKGNIEFTKYLIANGADVNKGDSYGTSVPAYAASTGQTNLAVYTLLFKTPTDIKQKNLAGANLILQSIAADRSFKLLDFFTKGGVSINEVDGEGATAFDYAAKTGDLTHMKNVLAKGAKPSSLALIFAAQGGRNTAASLDVYQHLIDAHKLNPLVANKEGNTVLHYLVRKQNQDEILDYFIAKGVDINKANEEGNTAFINAAAGKNLALINKLLPLVKDINAVNKKGESALTEAIGHGSTEIAALLIKNGANAKVLDKDGHNLLYYLVDHYRPMPTRGGAANESAKDEFNEKLALLLANGLSVNTPQKDGSTLFHVAIGKLDIPLLQRIEKLKVNVNAKNAEGSTVLHRAALISKDDKVLNYLLSIGADKSLKTDFDETAYDLAKENKFLSSKNIAVDFLK